MPIAGFDYKAFAADMAQQVFEVLNQPNSSTTPPSLTDQDKKLIVETVRKFAFMAGEALSNDQQLKFNADQASFVTNFIAEWTFHKSIDLIVSKIPPQNKDAILQVIAANIFNTAKLAIIKKMPQDSIIQLIDQKVNNVYVEELQKLLKKGILNEKQFEFAKNTSHLKAMVQNNIDQAKLEHAKNVENPTTPNDKKVLKLASLAIILKKLPEQKAQEILNSIDKQDAQHVLNYMRMSDIEEKIDHQVIIKSLEEIKKILPAQEGINVEKLLKKYHKLLKSAPVDALSKLAVRERESVKDFILDIKFPAAQVFSPLVMQALVSSIEEKLNDN